MDCVTCGMFRQFDAVANQYAVQAFEALAPWVRNGFTAFVGVWLAFHLGWRGVLQGNLRLAEMMNAGAIFAAVAVVLQGSGFYWDWIYLPGREVMSGLTQIVVSSPSAGIGDPSMTGLLSTVEREVMRVFAVVQGIISESNFYELVNLVSGVLLLLPYVFVWGIFLAFLLEGTFKFLGVSALAPIFIACAAFKATRGFTMSAGRILLSGILTVVFAGVAMGFTITIVKLYTANLPMGPDGVTFVGDPSAFVLSREYFSILLIGFISILFHLKAATLASNISGAMDGPGAASAVVATGMMGIGLLKSAALAPAKPVIDNARRRYGEAVMDGMSRAASSTVSAARHGAGGLIERLTSRIGGAP
jgi:hypothetical protein